MFAAGSEDMDTLTFGTPILLKHLTASEAKNLAVTQVNLKDAIDELSLTMNQVCTQVIKRPYLSSFD